MEILAVGKKIYTLVALTALVLGTVSAYTIQSPAATSVPISEISFDSNFNKNKLNEFNSDYLIIDFWASWCQPCIESLPYYHQVFESLPTKQFEMLAVNLDKNKNSADLFLKQLNLSDTNVFYDPDGALQKAYSIAALPSIVILDNQYNEVARILGFNSNQQGKFKLILEKLQAK